MPKDARRPFSRPVFDQTVTIHSNHAQRLLDRGFLLVVRALYGIDVVLRILGDDEEMDQVEEIVGKLISELAVELRAEHARLAQLREANGISATPRYTNPKRITVHISSPQLAQYTALIEELDQLMTVMDALWLTGVLTNKQRADGAYQWRTRLLRTGREIIDIERRARKSAEKRGKGEELSEVDESVVAQDVVAPEEPDEDSEGNADPESVADAEN
ncbi:MAG: hypothetical protein WCA32_24480 [Chromatiaceae bacterium]